MKMQNAHENVLVVGQNCDSLDILDMRMLAKIIMTVSVYVQVYTCIYSDILWISIYRVHGSTCRYIMAHYSFLPHYLSTIHHGNQ